MNRLDAFFKKALSAMAVEPDGAVWSKLDNQLRKRKRRRVWQYSGAAAAVLLLAALTWMPVPKEQVVGTDHTGLQDFVDRRKPALRSGVSALPVPDPVQPVASDRQDTPGQDTPSPARVVSAEPSVMPGHSAIATVPAEVEVEETGAKESSPQITELKSQRAFRKDVGQFAAAPEPELTSKMSAKADPVPIRIIYKRGAAASEDYGDEKLIAKGVKKLEELAGGLRVSEETRTKLRRTREEVLAFNVEKLFQFQKEDKRKNR